MSYKIKATFPEGVTQDDIARTVRAMGIGPDNPPEGSISHEERVENGRMVIYDEFTSKDTFEAFLNEYVTPAHAKTGVPPPEKIEEL